MQPQKQIKTTSEWSGYWEFVKTARLSDKQLRDEITETAKYKKTQLKKINNHKS